MKYEELADTILTSYLEIISNNASTKQVLNFFRKMGEKRGRFVYPSSRVGEWVYDLCWSIEEEDWAFEKEHFVELVLESEWGKNWEDIAEDFYKLLDSKAPIKVGICQSNNKQILVEKIQKMISTFKIKIPEEYYIIFIHGFGWEECITGYIITTEGNLARKKVL